MDSEKRLVSSAWPFTLLPSVGSRPWLALCLARIGEHGEALSEAEVLSAAIAP